MNIHFLADFQEEEKELEIVTHFVYISFDRV